MKSMKSIEKLAKKADGLLKALTKSKEELTQAEKKVRHAHVHYEEAIEEYHREYGKRYNKKYK